MTARPTNPKLSTVPQFSSPPPLQPSSPTLNPAVEETNPEPVEELGNPSLLSKVVNRKHARTDRTGISVTERPEIDPANIQAVMIGLVGLLFVGGAWMFRQRTKTALRVPTEAETQAIAVPLARLTARHADLSVIGPDLADVVEAGSAFGAYLAKGPLRERPASSVGEMPHPDET